MSILGLIIRLIFLGIAIYWMREDLEKREYVEEKDYWLWVAFLIVGSWGWGIPGLVAAIFFYVLWSRIFH